jgi:peptidoglycan-associated lipoprotein
MVHSAMKWLSFGALVLSLNFAACSDDEKKAQEPVAPAATEQPATPPDANASFQADNVYFSFDEYALSSDAQSNLNKMAEHLKGQKSAVLQIEGHCDERGSTEYNLALGERRAQSVKNYLTQLGVEAARVPTISYGEERPAVEGHDEAAWAKNRRAQFSLSAP